MWLHQIVYVRAASLDALQTAVEEEFIERAENGHTFIQALPIVPPQRVVSVWVQPLVFQYEAEPAAEGVIQPMVSQVAAGFHGIFDHLQDSSLEEPRWP